MKKTLFALIACISIFTGQEGIAADGETRLKAPYVIEPGPPLRDSRSLNRSNRDSLWSSLAYASAFTGLSVGTGIGTYLYKKALIAAISPYITRPGAQALVYGTMSVSGLCATGGTISMGANAWLLWRNPNNPRF